MNLMAFRLTALATATALMLTACGGGDDTPASVGTTLTGVAATGAPLANAAITVVDVNGAKKKTTANAAGEYTLDVGGMTAPLLISAVQADNANCSDSTKPWGKCLAALLGTVSSGSNIANVNPLSDKVVSDVVATYLKAGDSTLVGPQSLVDKGSTAGLLAANIKTATDEFRPVVLQALVDANVAQAVADTFDPVTTPMKADHTGVDAVLDVLLHNRGYDNNSGKPGGTMLLDANSNYIGKMDAKSAVEPLNYKQAKAALAAISDTGYTRVLIVGDSTASTYEAARAPREGWGQEFETLFKSGAKVKVINGAKSGRSSRNFYNQGYYDQMAQYLRAGDYVIINHGHNDQNCDSTRADRGAADVANTCTYPNDASGNKQYPAGKPEMSFQNSLENYIKLARAKGAIPILMTPTTRVKDASGTDGAFPVATRHFTTQNAKNGYAFVGDYIATIKKTASDNNVPLIDLEAKTMAFANSHQADWKDYWLAADPVVYPWYATQTSGILTKPDTTHFQKNGAIAVANLVAQGIAETSVLADLAGKLASKLAGVAATGAPLAGADITVCDATGAKTTAKADASGAYSLDVSGMTAPLLVGAQNGALTTVNGVPQPINGTILYTALLPSTSLGINVANVNQLTDKIASDVAITDAGLKGSIQLFNACKPSSVTTTTIASKTSELRGLLSQALTANGVLSAATFDPVSVPMLANHRGVDAVLDAVRHNRDGWGSGSDDQLRGSKLYDLNMQEISTKNVSVDPALQAWSSFKTRIFVVGDSTASNYGLDVAPRMGWGQTFDRFVKDTATTKVVNLAQSGRSSRSFITEGWFKMLSDNLQTGDYVLMQWGHNDEKCGTTASLDWVNRCTYPNDASGNPQVAKTTSATSGTTTFSLPAGVTVNDLSFQKSLEKYAALAKAKGATLVLLTPVTRINQNKTVTTYVEGSFPISKSTHITTSGDFYGNYSQTVSDTGKANNVAVVDLDGKSIAFMNSIGVGTGGADATAGWRDYHLAVSDFTKYPYYALKTTTGHYLNADRTHFQENGAVKVGSMIVEGIKADSTLSGLAALLK